MAADILTGGKFWQPTEAAILAKHDHMPTSGRRGITSEKEYQSIEVVTGEGQPAYVIFFFKS